MSSAFRNFKSVDAAVTRVVVKISCCASVSNEHASVQIRRRFLCNQEIDRYLFVKIYPSILVEKLTKLIEIFQCERTRQTSVFLITILSLH